MNIATIIGFSAGICSSISLFPQVYKCFKTKKTTDVSLPMFLVITIASIFWIIYGLMIHASPIIVTNIIVLTSALLMLILKVKYG